MDPSRDQEIVELFDRVRAGETTAWIELTDRYTNLLWSVARALRLPEDDAADAIQTTWLRLVERLETVRDPRRLGGWLSTTMRRESLSLLRRRSRHVDTDALDNVADDAEPLDAALLRNERDSALWRAFRRLDQRCQQLLRMLMADPPPRYRDVAGALGVPIGYIGPTRMRCLQKLRDAYDLPA
ncbi:MAG TPA: sigma-70 family RNA polymerase sigma factor [Asanoa sp.]